EPHRAGDDVLEPAVARLFLGQEARPDLLVDQRVVLGELVHVAVADEVGAAVADVADQRPIAFHQQRNAGGAHAGQFAVGAAGAEPWTASRSAPESGVSSSGASLLNGSSSRIRAESSSRSMVCTASRLAVSPPAWPPMPSQTTYRPRSSLTRKLSSLCSRFMPTSVRAAKPYRAIYVGRLSLSWWSSDSYSAPKSTRVIEPSLMVMVPGIQRPPVSISLKTASFGPRTTGRPIQATPRSSCSRSTLISG